MARLPTTIGDCKLPQISNGIPTSLRIALGIRLGYPVKEESRARARRGLDDFVSYNRYQR